MSVILSAEELGGIKNRSNLLQVKSLELGLLNKENNDYMSVLLDKYGLDVNEKYDIDDRGVVSEHTDKHSVVPEVKPAGPGDNGSGTKADTGTDTGKTE